MLKMRIIPCLDVNQGKVVKGIRFKNHEIVGDILPLAQHYSHEGADELVFYDITASVEQRQVDTTWVQDIAKRINIPFCVAGGIQSIADAERLLAYGADKISINTPALQNPQLITELAKRFGAQCVVVGIDSDSSQGHPQVYQYTGDPHRSNNTQRLTEDWAREAVDRGAGELVLNCMNKDGLRAGYDLDLTHRISQDVAVPVIASGGAGCGQHFIDLFTKTQATGALAASIFHKNSLSIKELKCQLQAQSIPIRPI
jgi:cyclase